MLIKITLSPESSLFSWHLADGPDGIDEESGICKTLEECFAEINSARKNIANSYCESIQHQEDILDDGCILLSVGTVCGVVSSHHLIEPKLNQLRASWKKKILS